MKDSNNSPFSLAERLIQMAIKVIPIRKGKERIVDYIRPLLNSPEGSIRLANIDRNITISVDIFERIQSYMYFIGDFERYETRKLIESIHLGDVVLDVGANIGYFSLIASNYIGADGKVFAFEASPRIYESLCNNCTLSKEQNIFPKNLAVSDRQGILKFNLPRNPQEQGSGSLSNDDMGDIEVVSITIDQFAQEQEFTRLDYIKMDVEGAEVKALLGMKSTISRYKPKILLEFSPSRYAEQEIIQFEDFVVFMKDLGYKFSILNRNGKWKDLTSFPKEGVSMIYASVDLENA